MPVETIRNFLPVDERIATGGQPTERELAEVAAAGYASVVNLGLLDPRYCLSDEAGLAASLGLRYHHIPVQFDAPTIEDFRAFAAAMDTCAPGTVFVHCAANYRASAFVALYGERKLGWTRERSEQIARAMWQPNDTWSAFLEQCRRELAIDAGREARDDRLAEGGS